MKQVQRIYNYIVEDVQTEEDIIIRLNDLLKVYLLLCHRAFSRSTNRSLLIDSIKKTVNTFVTSLMSKVTEEENKTIETNE